jgi:hypothetical protein
VFTAAVFTSALLLFAVQPMFARMVLPRLGGSPSVWSVAMVFFQTMLLAGYAYAHMLMRAVRPPIAIAVHIVLLITAGLMLPLSIASGWGDPPGNWTALWLIGVFATSIGLPFFTLAANNPLLQAWFVRTGHVDGRDPYFLYAASNIGSFLALLSYPFILEPTLSLRQHILLWSGGYWLLFVLIVACGYLLLRSPARFEMAEGADAPASPAPTWLALGRWAFIAFVPSGLLVAVTAYISTEIAAAPLLWVIPLSLYLLTWVLVFQSRPLLPASLDAGGAAFRNRRNRRAAGVQRKQPADAAQPRRTSARLFRDCHGLPRGTRAPAAAGGSSDDILSGAVGRRHDRRPVRRPDRAFRVLMDRRVSDPARARRNLPADREVRLGAPRSCVLGGGRRARAGAARPGPRLRLATARG